MVIKQESIASLDDVFDGSASIDEKIADPIARKENVAVAKIRAMAFIVLFVTTIIVATRVYLYTRNDQVIDFENGFDADATKVIESFQNSIEGRLEAVDALSVSITSFAHATGATFPNVTIPDFGVRGANSRVMSGSVFLQYLPVVTDENREGWEAYEIANRGHYIEELSTEMAFIKDQDSQFNKSEVRRLLVDAFRDTIENLTPNGTNIVAPPESGPYLPVWQHSPVTPTKALLNFNALTHPASAGGYREAMTTGQAVIEAAINLAGEHLGRTGIFFKTMLSMSQYRHDMEEYLGDPVSTFAYPVFDTFNTTSREVVALIGTSLYWRLYFKNVLPPNTRGIICVLENTKGQVFSYRIDDTVTYMGVGDHHHTKYDHLVKESEISTRMMTIAAAETKSFTSVKLNSAYCSYKLRVYPSQDTEADYLNRRPVYLALVIMSVFLITCAAFVLYTIAVNRRNRVVMHRAEASSAIVSSLFPSQIRDQLYEENAIEKTKKSWKRMEENFDRMDAFDMGSPKKTKKHRSDEGIILARPIAEVFKETTIMFADMVGFTSWSSTRDPVEVFELLETLYQAFDEIAIRRRVFKVETIGDCYVAAAGIPQAQEDHAIIMARFASDCLSKMGQLTTELAGILGEDTADLRLRIGLHSGPVTGGVLRGQKSRFQLFGDTVNTTARMESTGEPGCIHTSQETANALIEKGKMSWIAAREEKIVAKGKGELQTYWLNPRSTGQSILSSPQRQTRLVTENRPIAGHMNVLCCPDLGVHVEEEEHIVESVEI